MRTGKILEVDNPGTATAGRRGRRRVSDLPEEREKHVSVCLAKLRGASTAELARVFDVSERTILYWVRHAMSYGDPRIVKSLHRHTLN